MGSARHVQSHYLACWTRLWLQGVICIEPLTGNSELPPGWELTFGMKCRPVKLTTHWPAREELKRLLSAQLARIIDITAAASEAPWLKSLMTVATH